MLGLRKDTNLHIQEHKEPQARQMKSTPKLVFKLQNTKNKKKGGGESK